MFQTRRLVVNDAIIKAAEPQFVPVPVKMANLPDLNHSINSTHPSIELDPV